MKTPSEKTNGRNDPSIVINSSYPENELHLVQGGVLGRFLKKRKIPQGSVIELLNGTQWEVTEDWGAGYDLRIYVKNGLGAFARRSIEKAWIPKKEYHSDGKDYASEEAEYFNFLEMVLLHEGEISLAGTVSEARAQEKREFPSDDNSVNELREKYGWLIQNKLKPKPAALADLNIYTGVENTNNTNTESQKSQKATALKKKVKDTEITASATNEDERCIEQSMLNMGYILEALLELPEDKKAQFADSLLRFLKVESESQVKGFYDNSLEFCADFEDNRATPEQCEFSDGKLIIPDIHPEICGFTGSSGTFWFREWV